MKKEELPVYRSHTSYIDLQKRVWLNRGNGKDVSMLLIFLQELAGKSSNTEITISGYERSASEGDCRINFELEVIPEFLDFGKNN